MEHLNTSLSVVVLSDLGREKEFYTAQPFV